MWSAHVALLIFNFDENIHARNARGTIILGKTGYHV